MYIRRDLNGRGVLIEMGRRNSWQTPVILSEIRAMSRVLIVNRIVFIAKIICYDISRVARHAILHPPWRRYVSQQLLKDKESWKLAFLSSS